MCAAFDKKTHFFHRKISALYHHPYHFQTTALLNNGDVEPFIADTFIVVPKLMLVVSKPVNHNYVANV